MCRALKEADTAFAAKQRELDGLAPRVQAQDQKLQGLAGDYENAMACVLLVLCSSGPHRTLSMLLLCMHHRALRIERTTCTCLAQIPSIISKKSGRHGARDTSAQGARTLDIPKHVLTDFLHELGSLAFHGVCQSALDPCDGGSWHHEPASRTAWLKDEECRALIPQNKAVCVGIQHPDKASVCCSKREAVAADADRLKEQALEAERNRSRIAATVEQLTEQLRLAGEPCQYFPTPFCRCSGIEVLERRLSD